MGYIEDKEAELLQGREDWVKNRISTLKAAREEIETRLAEGSSTVEVRYTGLPVGYVDPILKELQSWYLVEPSEQGKVELYMTNDDRNNTDSIVARLA